MASRKVERFEDLIAWEKAMDLAVLVYDLSRRGKFARDFSLCDQIHRAGISVPANIAEGFERGSRAEFHRFLGIAKGSCGEVRTHLYLAERLGYLEAETAIAARSEAEQVSRIISKLRTTVAKQRDAAKK
ncbi:MAG TPA: four helix bundle protein [Thermoanaerobaculia bacterium]|nr:four helix bundle protein [Thermoanaerobaculia bacterium]